MQRIILVTLFSLVALVIGGYAGFTQFGNKPPELSSLEALELPDIDKQVRRGSEWSGQVVVLNHWATWCAPCREEIPMLVDFNQQMADKGVQVIGVAHDLLDSTRAFSDEIGMDYPSLVAITGGNELLSAHGNTTSGALPFTVVFNREGEIARTHLGILTAAELADLVNPLL